MAHRKENLRRAAPQTRGTAGGSLTNRCIATHCRVLVIFPPERPSHRYFRRNGPEPSRARPVLARRSEPLTARTVLASDPSRRAALVGKSPFPLVSSERVSKPLLRPPRE